MGEKNKSKYTRLFPDFIINHQTIASLSCIQAHSLSTGGTVTAYYGLIPGCEKVETLTPGHKQPNKENKYAKKRREGCTK